MVDVAQLRVVIGGDDSDAQKKLSSVNEKVKASSGFFKDALANALGYIGGAIGVSSISDAFGLVKDTLVDVVRAGMDANQVDAQLAAGLRSTHDASGMTTQSLNDLADQLSGTTGITDDAVKSSAAMLLTFTSIGKDVFPQATQAVADLATKMANGAVPNAQQMEQASIQLGKALGNPLTGFTALQRVGVTFSEQQKEQIKNFVKVGDTADAQRVILKEMNKEFGGSATAAGQANGGMAILSASFDNMKEKVGQAIIPILVQLAQAVEPLVQSFSDWLPTALAGVQGALTTVGPVLQQVGGFLGSLFQGLADGKGPMSDAQSLLTPLKDAFVGVGQQLGAVVIPAVQQLGQWFQTTLVPAVQALMPHLLALGQVLITQVFPALVSLEGAALKVWAVIETALLPVIEKLLPIVLKLAGWLSDQLGAALKVIMPSVQQAAAAVSAFGDQLQTRLGPAIQAVWDHIQAGINFILPIWNAVWPSMQQVLAGVWQVIQGIIQVAWSIVSGIIKVGLDLISGKWGQAWGDLRDMLGGVWAGIQKMLGGALTVVEGLITGAFTGLIATVKQIGGQIIQGLIDGIKNMAGAAGDAIKQIGSNMLGGLKGLLGIHSPSTVFAELGQNLGAGLIQGFQGVDIAGGVSAHLAALARVRVGAPGTSGGVSGTGGSATLTTPGLGIPAVAVSGTALASGGAAQPGAGVTQVIQLVLDGRTLTESVVRNLPREVRLATGLKV